MVKRKYIQLLCALVYNANLPGFARGTISKAASKGVCVPGLNCYSCPGAVAACPLGSLQASFGEVKQKFPFYIVGMLLLFGVLFGRGICAFLCPFGLIQELLYKAPMPKLKKNNKTRHISLIKYFILFIFVLLLPFYYLFTNGVAVPAFCKYICPAGTLEAGAPLLMMNQTLKAAAGVLFSWKVIALILIIAACLFIYRAFCRFLCPLGAIYSLFNKYALAGIKVDIDKCNNCGACIKYCKTDALKVNDRECIRCGDCAAVCKRGAIYRAGFKTEKGLIKE